MFNRNLVRALSVLLGVIAFGAFTSTAWASASELSQAQDSVEARIIDATSSVAGSSASPKAGATVSRRKRKRVRRMTTGKARSNARRVARYVYLDPDLGLTEYGVRNCQRISRPRVDCYTYVAGPVYDDGYYLDTILCDWITASAYLRSGRMKLWTYDRDCVPLSEV